MTTWTWSQSAAFAERVERLNLHGLHFQHATLCERRAWLYLHRVNFAQWCGRVALGTVRHEIGYARDRSVQGLLGLAPDRIDWERHIVYENKGTGGAREAADNQTAFYALMLSIATGVRWTGATHVLSTRRRRDVELDDARLEGLWEVSERLERIAGMEDVPPAPRIQLCAACSAVIFCGYG
jgi:CRISPR-associated exonuclease Cas4